MQNTTGAMALGAREMSYDQFMRRLVPRSLAFLEKS